MMNASKYIGVMETIIPNAATLFLSQPWSYQDDNAPCHRAKTVKWMADHNIDVISWPARSPDLNPIDNLWHRIVPLGLNINLKPSSN